MSSFKKLLFEQFSLTPALSRWERGNHRQMVCDANNQIGS
jgi:hypothetical protein